MARTHGIVLRAALVCLLAQAAGAAQSSTFAGAWRGVSGDAGLDVRSMRIELADRGGSYAFVRATSSGANAAADVARMEGYFDGPLGFAGMGVLRNRRVVERIPTSDGGIDVIGVTTLRLLSDGDALRLDVDEFPEGLESQKLSTGWKFEREHPVAAAQGGGEQSAFTVLRPTFFDAFKLPATGETVQSSRALEAGARYRVRVEGSVSLAPAVAGRWVLADAAYVYYAEQDSTYFGRTPARVDILYLDQIGFDSAQPYNNAHVYTMDITGAGAPLEAVVFDAPSDDNSGSLDLRIYRLHEDVLQADTPSSIDPALGAVDALLDAGRPGEALAALRDAAAREADVARRERLHQLVGVLDFVASRPLDPEQLQHGVVMDEANSFGRAVRHDRTWPSALNNLAVWQAWNGNLSVLEGNAVSLLEEARSIAPDNAVIRGNLARLRAETGLAGQGRRR